MAKLIFKAEDVKRVVEHSIAAPEQRRIAVDFVKKGEGYETVYKDADEPSVILVHDRGVYLMSNGEPRDIVSGETSYVAYAKGCDPDKDEDWHENADSLVGGDDFCETLDFAVAMKNAIDGGAKQIIINLTSRNIGVTFK